MLTNQEVFDKIARGLLTQNKKSVTGGSCAYRGQDGCKCAVGWAIDDEHYDSRFEGSSLYQQGVQGALRKSGVNTSPDFLYYLQGLHDFTEPHEWPGRLAYIALMAGLNTDAIIKAQEPKSV